MTAAAAAVILACSAAAGVAILYTATQHASALITQAATTAQAILSDASTYTRAVVGGVSEPAPTATGAPPAYQDPDAYDPGPNIAFDPELDEITDMMRLSENRQPWGAVGVGEELVPGVPREDAPWQ